jgi:hypothetical protein
MLAHIHRKAICLLLLALAMQCAGAGAPPGLREALAEFETGTISPAVSEGDYAIGRAKEVSRFQILPKVWHEYSGSRAYHHPDTAWAVAVKILNEREVTFRKATNREWDGVDIYLMWNAPGLYERAKWDRAKVSSVVLARAQRFANLMQEREARRVVVRDGSGQNSQN